MRSSSKAPIPSHVNSAKRVSYHSLGALGQRRRINERESTDSCLHGNRPSNHADRAAKKKKKKVLVAIINHQNHKPMLLAIFAG
jgi:hypothetical protein